MKFIIGSQEIDVAVISEGTYRSPNTAMILRQLTVSFSIEGKDASQQYKHLVEQARKNGLVARDSNSEAEWELYDDGGTTWEGRNDYWIYSPLWELREKESE